MYISPYFIIIEMLLLSRDFQLLKSIGLFTETLIAHDSYNRDFHLHLGLA